MLAPRWILGLIPSIGIGIFLSALSAARAQDAALPSAEPTLSPARGFAQKGGAALYAGVCQGCHMDGGRGATGAGHYPPLADNKRLEVAEYPIKIVLHGLKGMPPVGKMMNDEQVAEVVNYIRSHFGNAYSDRVSARDVEGAR
jgi:mono/diheme cytochrome c family protein